MTNGIDTQLNFGTGSYSSRPQTLRRKIMSGLREDFIFSNGKCITVSDPDFAIIARLEFYRARKKDVVLGTKIPQKLQNEPTPSRYTRRQWLTKHFSQFRKLKENGEIEADKPNLEVSTWTQESVFRFLEFKYSPMPSSSESNSSLGVDDFPINRRPRRSEKQAFQNLFERKRKTTSRTLMNPFQAMAP